MNISEIIEILERRVANLDSVKTAAATLGDLDQIVKIEEEIAETLQTISKMRSLD